MLPRATARPEALRGRRPADTLQTWLPSKSAKPQENAMCEKVRINNWLGPVLEPKGLGSGFPSRDPEHGLSASNLWPEHSREVYCKSSDTQAGCVSPPQTSRWCKALVWCAGVGEDVIRRALRGPKRVAIRETRGTCAVTHTLLDVGADMRDLWWEAPGDGHELCGAGPEMFGNVRKCSAPARKCSDMSGAGQEMFGLPRFRNRGRRHAGPAVGSVRRWLLWR